MATKKICDICDGDLYVAKETPIGWFSDKYTFKRHTLLPMLLSSPFTGNCSVTNLEICSKCFDDFKEYVNRKKDCFKFSK